MHICNKVVGKYAFTVDIYSRLMFGQQLSNLNTISIANIEFEVCSFYREEHI